MYGTIFSLGFILMIAIAKVDGKTCDPTEVINPGLCADIVFAFDTSCSISDDTKRAMKDILQEFVGRFPNIATPVFGERATFTQFGLLRFDINSKTVFGFGDASTKDEVSGQIDEFDYTQEDCKTITHKALELAKTDFFDSGKVDERTPNVLILLTDGRTQPQKFIEETKAARLGLNLNNTYILLIQVPNKNEKTDEPLTIEQLQSLAPSEEDRFTYDESVDIDDLVTQVMNRLGNIDPCPACVAEDVDCTKVDLDVLLIIDHSNSIVDSNLEIVRNDMKKLVNSFDNVGNDVPADSEIGSIKFAIITYNREVIPVLYFNSTGASTKAGTLMAIDNADFTQAKDTRTDLALKFADKTIFNPNYGDRKEAQNVIVLFTDGRTMKARFQNDTIAAAQKLKDRPESINSTSVEIFLLGLPGDNKENNREQRQREWGEIPSKPLDTHFQEFKNFTEIEFFIDELKQRLCNIA